jgi:uncharacterized protein (TIGR02145 family)
MKKVIILLALASTAVFAQQKGTFTDPRDKKTYKTVKIGEQVWFAENLNYNAKGSKCYDNKESNCNKYGRLYDFATAYKACPKGWHSPNSEEWRTMFHFTEGDKKTAKLRASGWKGVDTYGFSALPGGYYNLANPEFNTSAKFLNLGSLGYWWSSNELDSDYAYSRDMYYLYDDAYYIYSSKSSLYSVRCVED